MHPSEAYFRSELMKLIQPLEQASDALMQVLAAYVPVLLTALVIILIIGGLAYLSKRWLWPAGVGQSATDGEIVVTEAGVLTVLQRAEEDLEIFSATWKMDALPPGHATCK